ncbi:DNA mismatch repair protein [Salmonella enterica subsp. enterica]|uniref:DNA mismatch repair protein n=7 Tax=Salmonella enterica TaxID=28901 RepID=A0A3G3DYN3_SALET|nr:ATP-binding protein [Salmonella enterica]EDA3959171.1 DNA mismatch repair protein [Salmonella enterica subsp. enterica serovar Enteritidis]EDR0791193.1 DNA mismatch repair protein [Salmonella enterica subsp. enterica serovar Rissen str. 150]AHN80851.1 DNA mismatch repair protein [Salmonella enterica subsp. enterica serovar Tennessee str. TXSC_TXSC08-19]AMW53545.1 DNA mismatch repair protein [Salmonella enterica subsp. enterica serovar Tennessee]AVV18909.1 DNA mismatch repair protein [Salmon
MAKQIIQGTTEINSLGIKNHFESVEPVQAILELVWNGFDAGAKNININIVYDHFDTVKNLTILDDGDGINFTDLGSNFNRFNDSLKKTSIDQHGSKGRGRLSFHRLCHQAIWYTKYLGRNAYIKINDEDIKAYEAQIDIDAEEQNSLLNAMDKGTCVELTLLHSSLPDRSELISILSNEFCCKLALDDKKRIFVNGTEIDIPEHEIKEVSFEIENNDFMVKGIRWDKKPATEKSFIYLTDSSGKIVHKESTTFNKKRDFHLSVFVSSIWADTFSSNGDDIFSTAKSNPDSKAWRQLVKNVLKFSRSIYDDFLRVQVEKAIQKLEEDGAFPTYNEYDITYASWKRNNIKQVVRSIYIADPQFLVSLTIKQKKIIIRLLDKMLVSNQNEDLFDILESVLDLSDSDLSRFASQLKKTKLENIISSIEELQRRRFAVEKLKLIMNEYYKEVLETPDLQKIIENNTWLFGERYETIGAEEDTFTKIAKSLRDSVYSINNIDEQDVENGEDIIGARRQTDLFLARRMPTFDSNGNKVFRCIIIEIKRPSIALNVKHLRQLEDYAGIIKRHPEFSSQNLHFELILIGRKISSQDIEIPTRLSNYAGRGDVGLVSDDANMKRYVKNWYTIFDTFELTNSFMLEKLQMERDIIEKKSREDLVKELQEESVDA